MRLTSTFRWKWHFVVVFSCVYRSHSLSRSGSVYLFCSTKYSSQSVIMTMNIFPLELEFLISCCYKLNCILAYFGLCSSAIPKQRAIATPFSRGFMCCRTAFSCNLLESIRLKNVLIMHFIRIAGTKNT